MNAFSSRAAHEIAHGRSLAAAGDTERIWGWGTPAGRLRALRRAELIARGAGLAPGVHALEIGCGTGLFTELFAASGANVMAIEISPDLLARARTRNLPSTVTLVEGDFHRTPLPGVFDAVVGSSVLHHLDVASALLRIRDLLKPTGVISFAEPNYLNPQVFLERTLRTLPPFRSYVAPDETAFVRWSFARLLRQSGFEPLEVWPFDWLHPATPPALIPFVSRCGAALESVPGLSEFAGSLYVRATRP